SIDLEAPRDIIVKALVQTTAPGSDVKLIADTDHDGSGGVWIQATGSVISAQDVIIQGSDLFATPGSLDSVRIDADGVNDQITAARDIVIRDSGVDAPAGADVVIE